MVSCEAENALSEIREVLASIKQKKNNYEDLINDITRRKLEENPDIIREGNIRLIPSNYVVETTPKEEKVLKSPITHRKKLSMNI